MGLRLVITALCAVGLYASVFMLRKTRAAERGELTEPSVVQRPAARLFGGQPNALFGIIFYAAVALAVWLGHGALVVGLVVTASTLAAGTSLYLAYSLLCVTKMPCPFCWTGHAVNWSLLICVSVWAASAGV